MALKADVSVEFVAKYGGEKIIKNAGYYFSKNGNYFKKYGKEIILLIRAYCLKWCMSESLREPFDVPNCACEV